MKILITQVVALSILIISLSACEKLEKNEFIPLRADFNTSQSLVQLGTPIAFNQTATQVADKFEWDFGDNTTSTDENPSHTYAKIGRYQVKLTVTKADGITKNTITKSVLVIPKAENAANFATFGDASSDESGLCFTREGDTFIIAGRKGLNTLLVVFAKFDLFNLQVLASIPFEFKNVTQAKITPRDIKITLDEGFMIVGDFTYNQGDKDSFILKLDKSGREQWRVVNATARNEEYNTIIDLRSIYLIAGTTSDSGNSLNNNAKIVVDFYDNNGVLQESLSDGNNWEVNDLEFTSDGFALAVTEGSQPSLILYNSSFLEPRKTTLNFNGKGLGVTSLNDGSYVMVGEITHKGDSTSAFIAKFDAFGVREWLKPLSYYHDSYFNVYENIDGSLVALGNHYNPISQKDVLISKYSSEGQLLASRLIGSMQDDEAAKLEVSNPGLGSIFALGTTKSFGQGLRDYYLIRLDKDLN
jgi:PKD repeat protein